MSQIDKKRILYLTSGSQLSQTCSIFKQAVQIPDNEEYDRITVTQASIPVSFYLVQQGQNSFTLTEGGTSVLITVPQGNYNANSFAIAVAALLTSHSPNNYTYTMSYPNSYTQVTTGLYTFVVNSVANVISITADIKNPLNEQLGFNLGSVNTFTKGVTTSTLVSTNVLNFVNENTLFLQSNVVDNAGDQVLQEIFSGNSGQLSVITFLNPDPLFYSKRLLSNKIKDMTISITNEAGIPIYLNGGICSITVVLYKDCDYYDRSKDFMKLEMKDKLDTRGVPMETQPGFDMNHFLQQLSEPKIPLDIDETHAQTMMM